MRAHGGNPSGERSERKVAKKRRYTAQQLEAAAEEYFKSITHTHPMTRQEGKGEAQPVYNDLGQEVEVTEYLQPPTENDLCLRLGIPWEQWQEYRRPASPLYPVTQQIRDRITAWCIQQLLTRPGKDLKGVELYLELLTPAVRAPEQAETLSLEEKLAAIQRIFGGREGEA